MNRTIIHHSRPHNLDGVEIRFLGRPHTTVTQVTHLFCHVFVFILLSSVSNRVLPDEHTNVLLLDVVSAMTLTDPLVVVW